MNDFLDLHYLSNYGLQLKRPKTLPLYNYNLDDNIKTYPYSYSYKKYGKLKQKLINRKEFLFKFINTILSILSIISLIILSTLIFFFIDRDLGLLSSLIFGFLSVMISTELKYRNFEVVHKGKQYYN